MADTSTTNLPEEIHDIISAKLLLRPDDPYLFAAYGPIQDESGELNERGVASVTFNRPVHQGGLYTESSRRMVETTDVSAGGIAIDEDSVTLTTREYGGPHDGTGVLPFAIREFLAKRSKHDLIADIGGRLIRDRNRFQDRVYMDLLLSSTNVVTPDGSAEGAIIAGKVANAVWLRKLGKQMKVAKVPTYENGRYRLVITPEQEEQLKGDADVKEAFRHLGAGNTPAFGGYVGTFDVFDIAVSTHLYTKGVGAGGAVVAQQAVAFGPYGLGHGTAMAPEPRMRAENDFGRKSHILWLSHEAFGLLYPDMVYRGVTT